MEQGEIAHSTAASGGHDVATATIEGVDINAAATRLLTGGKDEIEVDRRALVAYSSWLHDERAFLCRELYPHLGWKASHFIVGQNAGFSYHRPSTALPSTRAVSILAAVGCDWSQDGYLGIGDGGAPAPHSGRFPHPDAHLLDLCDAFDTAHARYVAAEALAAEAHEQRKARLDTFLEADDELLVNKNAGRTGWYWQGSVIRQILDGSYLPTMGIETAAIARAGHDRLKSLLPLAEARDLRIKTIDDETNYPALREAANDLQSEAHSAAQSVYRLSAETFEGLSRKIDVLRSNEADLWVRPGNKPWSSSPEWYEHALTEIADGVEHLIAHGVVRGSDVVGGAAYSGPEAIVSEDSNPDGTVTYLDASGKCWTNTVSHWIGFTAARMWAIARKEMGRQLNDPSLSVEARSDLYTRLTRDLRTDAIHGLAFRFEDAFRIGEDERHGVERDEVEPTVPATGYVSSALERAIEAHRETSQIAVHDPDLNDIRLAGAKARLTEAEAAILAIPSRSLADLRHKLIYLWPNSLEDHVPSDRIRSIFENFRDDFDGLCRDTSANPDASLVDLGSSLQTASDNVRRHQVEFADDVSAAANARFEELYEAGSALVKKIEAHPPAQTLVGLIAKAKAVSWCHCGDPIAGENFEPEPAADVRLAASIIADLLAMEARA